MSAWGMVALGFLGMLVSPMLGSIIIERIKKWKRTKTKK